MSDPQAITMTLLFTILGASLVGSLHCAGMCGGLVLFVVGADGSCSKPIRLQGAYHAGRGLSYMTLGAAAGALGGVIDGAGRLAGLQHSAAVIAGSMMVLFGLIALSRTFGMKLGNRRMPVRIRKLIESAHKVAMGFTPTRRAAAVGLLTPLLPCGWLYAFVAVSAGTASVLGGGLVMVGFWLGTLPVLAALGAGIQILTGPLRAKVPVISSLIVVVFGVLTALGRVGLPIGDSSGLEGSTLTERVEHVRSLEHADLPCCDLPDEVLRTEPES